MASPVSLSSSVINLLSSPRILATGGTLALIFASAIGTKSKSKSLTNVSMGLAGFAFTSLVAARLLYRREQVKADRKQLSDCLQTCVRAQIVATKYILLVNAKTQKLHVYKDKSWVISYPVSTAKNGVGQIEGSAQTPLGLHKVSEKIGEGALPLEIFDSRVNTRKQASLEDRSKAYIVGRILWLDGMEKGFNQGENDQRQLVDSKSRYIYLHGTSRVDQIGSAESGGCIRLKPDDVVELFNQVPKDSLVYIYQ